MNLFPNSTFTSQKTGVTCKKVMAYFLGLISILLVLLAIWLGLNWQPDLPLAQLKARWQLPSSKFIDIDSVSAHVALTPSCQNHRPALVLLHGTAASLHTWQGWSEALEQDYCVIRMDLPGFGLTGAYPNLNQPAPPQYSAENYVKFVVKVMDSLHISSATLVGNSLGGKVAWLTATTYPNRVNALILIDANGYAAQPINIPLAFKLAKYPWLDEVTAHILPKSLVRKSLETVYADDTKITEDVVERYYELALREGNRRVLPKRMREFSATSHQNEIGTIHVPTLILWGKQDQLIPVSDAYLFHQHIPHSDLVIFPNLGHISQEENPQATVVTVKDFLYRNRVIK